MATTTNIGRTLRVLKADVSGFEKSSAARNALVKWVKEQNDSFECAGVLSIVEQGIQLHKFLDAFEEEAYDLWAEGKLDYDQGLKTTVDKLYESWLNAARTVSAFAMPWRARGFSIPGLDDLLQRIHAVETADD